MLEPPLVISAFIIKIVITTYPVTSTAVMSCLTLALYVHQHLMTVWLCMVSKAEHRQPIVFVKIVQC